MLSIISKLSFTNSSSEVAKISMSPMKIYHNPKDLYIFDGVASINFGINENNEVTIKGKLEDIELSIFTQRAILPNKRKIVKITEEDFFILNTENVVCNNIFTFLEYKKNTTGLSLLLPNSSWNMEAIRNSEQKLEQARVKMELDKNVALLTIEEVMLKMKDLRNKFRFPKTDWEFFERLLEMIKQGSSLVEFSESIDKEFNILEDLLKREPQMVKASALFNLETCKMSLYEKLNVFFISIEKFNRSKAIHLNRQRLLNTCKLSRKLSQPNTTFQLSCKYRLGDIVTPIVYKTTTIDRLFSKWYDFLEA